MTLISKFLVDSDTSPVYHTDQYIHSFYDHSTNSVSIDKNNDTSIPKVTTTTNRFHLRTRKEVGKLGLLLVGLGGNNGSTVTASILANRHNVKWNTKEGIQTPNYYGSLLMSSTARIGVDSSTGEDIFTPLNSLLPMINVNDIAIDGWDINDMNLADALKRSCVLDYDLQNKLKPYLKDMVPWPSISYPEFIASNQEDRANNILPGTDKIQHLHAIRQNIRDFKDKHNLDNVIILWTATTEKYCSVINGVHDTALNLLTSIQNSHAEISPSTIFAVASILEGCSFINGSPQNTLVPGCIELANEKNVFVAGDDFKSGQTKFKSVMMDFLVGAGIKPRSIVSYNHLGNNDGKNLSEPKQFRSKEISKSNVVDDIVASNEILYPKQKVEQDSIKMNGNGTSNGTIISNGTTKKETVQQEHPDHEIVIKYVPSVGDSKRALDEYESDIFMNGRSTIVVHNTCEDSLLAAPLILDLAIMCELCQRITYKVLKPGEQVNLTDEEGDNEFERFEAVLSVLSYWLKAPMVPRGAPVVNALFKQRACIENLLRICAGLPAETDLRLEHRSSLLLPKANKHMNGNH